MKPYALGPIVLSFLIAAPAWAQPEAPSTSESESAAPYSGIVIDPLGQPVAGARVSIPALGIETTTTKEGQVMLRGRTGTFAMTVSQQGFELYHQEIVLDESTAATGFEVLLEYAIGEVVVTGTKVERLAEESPVKTQVVSRDRIERREAATLADALEGTTGVRTLAA